MIPPRFSAKYLLGAPQFPLHKTLLEQLEEAAGAGELITTTITRHHADRVRSYRLLAEKRYRR